ncbi:MAG: TonB family protein [Elusimicrobiota bacterium]
MDFRKSVIISFVLHMAFLIFMPGFEFSTEKPNWVEVSVVTFPEFKQRTPDWAQGRRITPKPSKKTPVEEKAEQPVPVKEAISGIPVESEMPDIEEEEFKQDIEFNTPIEKTVPGRKESEGITEGEGEDKEMFITGPVSKRKVLRRVYPRYPKWAEEQGVEGKVQLKFWVSPEGMVTSVELERTSGYPDLDSRAMEAVKKYLFSPLESEEEQEKQWGTITIKYTLK